MQQYRTDLKVSSRLHLGRRVAGSPGGAAVSSQGREPLELARRTPKRVPEGRQTLPLALTVPPARTWVAAFAGLMLALMVVPASAQGSASAEPVARQAFAAVASEEQKTVAGSLTLSISERRGRYIQGETQAEMRKRLQTERALAAEGTVLFNRDGWLKDVKAAAEGALVVTSRTRTAEVGGSRRVLVEAKESGGDRKLGLIAKVTATTPGDAALTNRVSKLAQGIRWTESRKDGDRLVLRGERGEEKHEVAFAGGDRPQLRSWTLKRTVRGADGTVEQTYATELSYDARSALSRIEEWVLNPPPYANVAYRTTEVKKFEPIAEAAVGAQALSLRFPKGTVVTDARGEVKVEYEQTEEGVDEADVAQFAAEEASRRIKIGSTASLPELKEANGKPLKTNDFKGKAILLFWFASWSDACEDAAKTIAELHDRYRRRGLQVIGINVAEEDSPGQKAEAFKKRFNWSFPVVLDLSGDTQRRFGAEPAVPKVAVIDPDGKLTYVSAGILQTSLEAAVEKVLPDKR
jgi:peroxiredoxin